VFLSTVSITESNWIIKNRKQVITLLVLFIVLLFFSVLSIGTGPVSIAPSVVLKILVSKLGLIELNDTFSQFSAIVFSIRLPRIIMAILVGATLAISGAALQGLFRNPLADPTLIGVSSGSALAAAAVIILGGSLTALLPSFIASKLLPISAFLGGLIATWLVYIISTQLGRTSVATMLLAGIAINALAAAGIGYLIFTANDIQIRDITFWTLGSIGGSVWNTVFNTAPFLSLSIIGLSLLSRQMNLMLLGETAAKHLGMNTERIKKLVILLAALGIGSAVSVSGIIGFVGLVVPHLLRLFIGPDHRFLMPGSILLGALLLLSADFFARMVAIPAELPIGIVTATIGAPFFLWLLIRNRSTAKYL
tara:strand:+ start:30157 stop:31251 length:1095 start_codon:yes stop_codon:yes gene_type:complete